MLAGCGWLSFELAQRIGRIIKTSRMKAAGTRFLRES
jgi:hypothetical protein